VSPINAAPIDSGRGHIMCNACGQPLRDHRVRQLCPVLAGERVTVGSARSESPEAIRRRQHRAKPRNAYAAACERCGAGPGERCRSLANGRPNSRPHDERGRL
jgi:hypothetical protein